VLAVDVANLAVAHRRGNPETESLNDMKRPSASSGAGLSLTEIKQ
jgi:hypothetical protein